MGLGRLFNLSILCFSLLLFLCKLPSLVFAALPGDLDGDGDVDIFDYNQLVSDFGMTGSPGFVAADIDQDGDVDIFDYNTLVTNFGTSGPTPTQPPDPYSTPTPGGSELILDASYQCVDSFQGEVTLNWTVQPNANEFEIYRCMGNYCENFTYLISDNVPPFVDREVTEGLVYTYQVRACSSGVCSPFSNSVSILADYCPEL